MLQNLAQASLAKKAEETKKARQKQDKLAMANRYLLRWASVRAPEASSILPLGMSEIDRLLNHISKCFVLPPGATEELAEQVVDVDLELRRDGGVEKITFVDNGRLTTDRNYRIVALAARRAVLDCAPLPLPPEKYESWKILPIGFNSPLCNAERCDEDSDEDIWKTADSIIIDLPLPFLFSGQLYAQSQRLYVTEGQIEPIPVAIADFTGLDGAPSDVGRQIAQIISDDLVSSGLFLSIDSAAFIAPPASPDVRPNFADWTPLGAKGLVIGSAFLDNDGALQIEFALWDVISQRSITEGAGQPIRRLAPHCPSNSRFCL